MTNNDESVQYRDTVFWQEILAHKKYLMAEAVTLTHDVDTAKDLVQTTMVHAFNRKNEFSVGANASGWLSTIMRNHFYSGWRKIHSTAAYLQFQNMLQDTGCNTFMEYYNKVCHDFEIVLFALAALPYRECSSLIMCHFGGYTYEEVAEEMSLIVGTAKACINRAITIVATQISNGDIVICDINLWIKEKIVFAQGEKQMLLAQSYQELLSSYNAIRTQSLSIA